MPNRGFRSWLTSQRIYYSDSVKATLVLASEMKKRARGRAKRQKKADITQRAKVRYCLCCARPTHIAVSARYEVGELSPQQARGISLRMEHGPWAARYYAARLYAQHWGYLPTNWDWAEQSLDLPAPPRFDGVSGSVREKSHALCPRSKQVDDGPDPKLGVQLNAGMSPPDEYFLTRQRQPWRGLRRGRAELVQWGERPPPPSGPKG